MKDLGPVHPTENLKVEAILTLSLSLTHLQLKGYDDLDSNVNKRKLR